MTKLSKNDEPLLTAGAVSKWLRISEKTLGLWAESRKIPASRVDGEWRFRERALARWVKSQTHSGKKR
jgi:excisionase family DNA binding protein